MANFWDKAKEWLDPLDGDAGIDFTNAPVIRRVCKDTIEKKTSNLIENKVDDSILVKGGSLVTGGVLGGVVGKKLGGPLGGIIGTIGGAVVMSKIGHEIARDFGAAADNTKQKGCDGIDKFKNTAMAFGSNLMDLKGQKYDGKSAEAEV